MAVPLAARGFGRTVSEIVSWGHAYPSDIVDNDAFFARCCFPMPALESIVAETKMRSRPWCKDDENTWTMARTALAMALEGRHELRDEIDLVLVASGTTMPVLHPPDAANAGMADIAPLALRELGRDDALGLDIKACYCTGFLRGLHVMDAMLTSGRGYRAGLVIATEQGSRFATAASNRSTFCFIMSDAAGVAVLRRREREEGERVGIVDYVGWTEASKLEWAGIGPDAQSTIMRGARAGEATHTMLVTCARTLLDRNGLTIRDLDWVVPLQTHARIVEGFRTAIDCPSNKLVWSGDVTGLSGSASIPACLSEHVAAGKIRKGELVLSVAVGAGMNCAGALYYA